MNPKIQAWGEDEAEHKFIVAGPWVGSPVCVLALCEACGTEISLWPVSLTRQGPLMHVICRGCLEELRQAGEVEFGGWIHNNTLPEGLQ